MTDSAFEGILYRKQFFYGPEKAAYPGWKTLSMPDATWLSSHPNLNIVRVDQNGFTATLIGFLLDPESPAASDEEILKRLCQNSKSVEDFIELTAGLGGRWAILLKFGPSFIVFTDAAATRSVFYHVDKSQRVWLATQPGLLAEKFGFAESEESKEFRASPEFNRKVEVWWPGESTPFAEVKQLLPNHLLDLGTGKVKRYWPNKPLSKYSLQDGVQVAGNILKGILAAAHQRYPLAMSLSSGLDSRTVFAACQDFAGDMLVFNMKYRNYTDESDDVRVPAQMAQTLKLKNYKVFDCRDYRSDEFKQLYDRHVVGLKTDWENIAEARLHEIPADAVVLKGSISEIMRCRYWNVGVYPVSLTFESIVRLVNQGNSKLVRENLKKWMEDALPAERYGVKLLDLLTWEVEVANWYSMGHSIFDIAQEDFTPFNNRRFFEVMLGIDPKYRSYPYHIAQREIVKYLWPELAQFPYTPSRKLPRRRWYDSAPFMLLRKIKKLVVRKSL